MYAPAEVDDLHAPEPPAAPEPAGASSVIVGFDSELRTLLRGLLRLRRFQIVGESDGGTPAEELLASLRPALLVIDGGRSGQAGGPLVRWARAHLPTTRIVLIGAEPEGTVTPPEDRPDAVIPRPFRIREFDAAVDPAATT